jgi:hypothetical protein
MFLLHALWFFVSVVVPILIPVAYAAVGARVLTYAVQNRVPLKIAPGFGEWAVMAAYCTVGWPVALMLWRDLRPALQPMNRRDRDRLAMAREIDAMEDSVKFAATKEVHRAKMDELHNQLRQIEHSSTLRALEAASKDKDEEEKEPVVLGFDAQKMLHMAEYTQDPVAYREHHKIKVGHDYGGRQHIHKHHGCEHRDIGDLLDCQNCSPIAAALRVKKTQEREAAKARGKDHYTAEQSRPSGWLRQDDVVDAELA